MSLLNGLGSGLRSFGEDLAVDEAAKETQRMPLLNSAPPAAAPSSTPTPAAPPLPEPVAGTDASAGHGNALDPATVQRAHQVYTGLVDRGIDPTTAVAFAANAVQESRADPATKAGDMGAAHGLMMWRDDRLANYVAKFGHAPEQGNLNEQLDFIAHEIQGPEASAWQKIQAAAPDVVSRAGAVSQFYERPKDTAAEIARRGWIANQLLGHFAQLTNRGVA